LSRTLIPLTGDVSAPFCARFFPNTYTPR
jgi:hypothetical protein